MSSEAWRLGRHGAFDKKTEELRVSCNAYYCGTHFRRQESFEMVPREIIEREFLDASTTSAVTWVRSWKRRLLTVS